MKTVHKTKIVLFLFILVGFAIILGSCQQVFTRSLFSFLQRDPSTLSPEQQLIWAENALASGDPAIIKQAYDVLKDAAADSPANGELNYMAANLALELSGIPDMLTQLMNDDISLVDETDLEAFLGGLSATEKIYLAEAGGFFISTFTHNPFLSKAKSSVLRPAGGPGKP